ncbi:hypothetical protein LFAB_16930 [Lactiplantibacillus fabifermentans T30PCM01]|uniref:Extracellular protein n=1 Tax=Lactiplantibacillus fabifermentans T30PCM01 TaxID=1400520 RepID=W6T4E3_9LACO|nr:hypothetical protein [Lactiplantibacillus fabifermentans]ETY72558.1 hypothetical protein LFAB_16930 [Lactiplantibacillus fabifermentans T30PCM01]
MQSGLKMVMTTAAIFVSVTSISALNGQASTKTVKQLPNTITKTTWYMQTDGYQGGYNEKGNFVGNTLKLNTKMLKDKNWQFTNIKQTSKNVYYAQLHFSKTRSEPVKLVIRNSKKFDIMPKHMYGVKQNYGGTENYGAMIFIAKKAASTKTAVQPSFTVKAPTGTWKSNTANHYQQVWSFSQKNGLNATLYQNGKKVKTLIAYGNYQVSEQSRNFWKLTTKTSGSTKKTTTYLRYTAANKFQIVNSKNQIIATKAGVAPAANWSFTKTK